MFSRFAHSFLALSALAAAMPAAAQTVQFTTAGSTADETAASHAVQVSLSAPASAPVTVDVRIPYSEARNHGRCSAKDFDLATERVRFEAGEQTKALSFQILNDAVFEADEAVELELWNPAGVTLGGIINHTVIIADDDRPQLVSVQPGASSSAIQALVDSVAGSGGGVLLFEPGSYTIADTVTLRPTVTYVGYGAQILRPANQPNFEFIFRTDPNASVSPADRVVIQGFAIDGNRENQGPYRDFELQQQHMILLVGNDADPDRLNVAVEDLQMVDGVADAINIWHDVDAKICHLEVRDVFRGAINPTAGNTRVAAYDVQIDGPVEPTGVDVEVDGQGAGGSWVTHVAFERMRLMDGDFDVSNFNTRGDVSTSSLSVKDVVSRGSFQFFLTRDMPVDVSDSEFWFGVPSCCGGNQIFRPGDVTFDHTTFVVTEDRRVHAELDPLPEATRTLAALDVDWNDLTETLAGLTCSNCRFEVDDNVEAADTVFVAKTGGTNTGDLIINGGSIAPEFTAVFGPTCENCIHNPGGGDGTTPGRRFVAYERDAKAFGIPQPLASLAVSPVVAAAGANRTLAWVSENATSCSGEGFDTGNATSGTATVSPSTTTEYSVTCRSSTDRDVSAATAEVGEEPPEDVTPPTVAITSPQDGANVTRTSTVTIAASASDNVGVVRVEFRVGSTLLSTDTTAPYTASWKVPGKRNARYILSAKAFDAAGNSATASVTVTAR